MNVSEMSNEEGTLNVLAKRFTEERLPKALALKEKVDQGKLLDDFDIEFLQQVLADARNLPLSVQENAKYRDIAGRVIQLYSEITAKALENEKAQKA
jgi:hypothetical protein